MPDHAIFIAHNSDSQTVVHEPLLGDAQKPVPFI